jgi:hypothetical protein
MATCRFQLRTRSGFASSGPELRASGADAARAQIDES